jgi:hypothetical protein
MTFTLCTANDNSALQQQDILAPDRNVMFPLCLAKMLSAAALNREDRWGLLTADLGWNFGEAQLLEFRLQGKALFEEI